MESITHYNNNKINNGDDIRGIITPQRSPSVSNGNLGSVKKERITYFGMLRKNKTNRLGEWLTYLASISFIQEITTSSGSNANNHTNSIVPILLLVKLFPNVIFLPLGGILADACDRRKIQVAIDLCSSCVVLVFLWSVTRGSILLCL